MRERFLIVASLVAICSSQAAAQPAPGFDPNQVPAIKGKVAQYSLTPRGDVDGVILDDGTQVHFPPHLGQQIITVVKLGDAVTVRGVKSMAVPMVQALSMTGDASGQTVIDQGPPLRPPGPVASQFQHLQVQGRVREPLYGPRGDVNGALLDDGTQLHFPPDQTARWAAALNPGHSLTGQGYGVAGPYGRSLDVQQLGFDPTTLTAIGSQVPPSPAPSAAPAPPPPALAPPLAAPPPAVAPNGAVVPPAPAQPQAR